MNRLVRLALVIFCLVQADVVVAQTSQTRAGDWEKTVEAGRKEGKVIAWSPPSAELRKLMELRFPNRLGSRVEILQSRGANIIRRMVDESKAGVHYFHVHIAGAESIITGLLTENLLE